MEEAWSSIKNERTLDHRSAVNSEEIGNCGRATFLRGHVGDPVICRLSRYTECEPIDPRIVSLRGPRTSTRISDEGRGFDMWDSGQEIVSRDRRETGKPQALSLSLSVEILTSFCATWMDKERGCVIFYERRMRLANIIVLILNILHFDLIIINISKFI